MKRSAAGAAGLISFASSVSRAEENTKISRVVLVRDARVLDDQGMVDPTVLGRMLDDAVCVLVEKSDINEAWKCLVSSDDTVGIKSNVAGPPRTPPELENAIRERVIAAGVDPGRVAVDDRGVLHNPVFQKANVLINVRPMRSHHWAGVGSLIKNYIMFSDNPPSWHEDSCANLAGLWELPVVRGKTRLNILVMLTPLFHSKGPHNYNKAYVWDYKGLLVGADPVAVDATGLRIIEAKRLEFFGEYQPLPVSPKHIKLAETKFGLGIADPARIHVTKLGWEEGILI